VYSLKDRELLLDALGQIDDALIKQAARPTKKFAFIRGICIATAACLALAAGTALFLHKRPGAKPEPGADSKLRTAENLWEKSDFGAYSLFYQTRDAYRLQSLASQSVSESIASKPLSVAADTTIKFETLLAQRYAVYFSSTGYPIFYDTQENREVDLNERILGDTSAIFEKYMTAAERKAEELYPGMLKSNTNYRIFREYSSLVSRHLPTSEIQKETPDVTFMYDLDLGYFDSDEERIAMFWALCWEVFVQAETNLYNQLYCVRVIGIDARGGLCILSTHDFYGNGCGQLIYDIKTDTSTELPNNGIMLSDGYIFHFSADSSIATIAFPDAGFHGGNLYVDFAQRYHIPSVERFVNDYKGEQYGVFFLNGGRAETLSTVRGASELLISPNNRVLYYKQMNPELSGKSFYASDSVWFNRLNLYNKDTDNWVFYTVTDEAYINRAATLQGNIVGFAAEESVVIMEQGGSCFAYSVESGKDITEEVRNGEIAMYAHEKMQVYLENGKLYRRDLFADSLPETICQAQQYVLSQDGAFVFAYQTGDSYVTCYNVATLESCRIDIDSQMCNQLFSTPNAILQMNYSEEENILLLSYYVDTDISTEHKSNVDFYELVEKTENREFWVAFPKNPVVITDYTISEELMDAFRESAYHYNHPDGVITWETYYPPFLSLYEDRTSILEKLGLPADVELDVNGTKFILYDQNGERLELIFYMFWGLFDYDDHNAGFEIHYYGKEGITDFTFNALILADQAY
jgi:hypothetical protein